MALAEPPTSYRMTCWDSADLCGESEEAAVRLVNNVFGEELVRRLTNSPIYKYPWYWVYREENKCNLRVKAAEEMPRVTSTMEWFDVNVCAKTVKKACLLRGGCE